MQTPSERFPWRAAIDQARGVVSATRPPHWISNPPSTWRPRARGMDAIGLAVMFAVMVGVLGAACTPALLMLASAIRVPPV